MFYNRRKVALFLPMYVIGGIIAFNLLKILLSVTEIKNYYTNHIIFLEISIVLGIVFFLSLIGVIYNVLKKRIPITSLVIWGAVFWTIFLIGSYFQMDQGMDKLANVMLSIATGILSGLVIAVIQAFKRYEENKIIYEIQNMPFRYTIHHEMSKHIRNIKKNKRLSNEQKNRKYKKVVKHALKKYQKLIKTVDHEQYEVLFNDANLKNPNYEEFKNFCKNVMKIRDLSIILGNIQTLNEILEEAEKQEAKNESTRLENLKKEVEGIILN
jgi:hypothetical protein